MASIPVPDEATWLALREQHVGGSEVASLFYKWMLPDGSEAVFHLYEAPPEGSICLGCLSSFKTGYRLWQEKAGRIVPDDLSDVERVQAGRHLEPALAAWANDKWEWKLRKVRRYVAHRTIKGWGASLDYEVVEKGMPPVEFKNVDGLLFRDQWVVDGDEILMPPLQYVLQLQHQIGAVDADHGWVVCCVGGNRLVRGRIERHEPTLEKIGAAIKAFWEGVEANVAPSWLADYETVAEEFRYGDKAKFTTLESPEIPALCKRYLRWKKHLAFVEATVDRMKGQIAHHLGDASKGMGMGYKISWPVIERPEKEIPARIQKALTYRGALTVTPVEE